MSFNKLSSLIANFIFILLILIADLFTSLSLYPLYLVPIFNFARLKISYLWIAVPIFSACSIFIEYKTQYKIYISNHFSIFIFRAFILFCLSYLAITYSSSIDKARRRFDQMKNLLPICTFCGSVYCSDGQWRNLETLLDNPQYMTNPSHSNCQFINTVDGDSTIHP